MGFQWVYNRTKVWRVGLVKWNKEVVSDVQQQILQAKDKIRRLQQGVITETGIANLTSILIWMK